MSLVLWIPKSQAKMQECKCTNGKLKIPCLGDRDIASQRAWSRMRKGGEQSGLTRAALEAQTALRHSGFRDLCPAMRGKPLPEKQPGHEPPAHLVGHLDSSRPRVSAPRRRARSLATVFLFCQILVQSAQLCLRVISDK